jgi:flagellar basal-body rod protein FlgB
MLFEVDLRGVERAMDGLAARFQAASHNLANVSTPGYQRQVVDFEASLKDAIAAGEVHIDPERPMDEPPPDPTAFLESWQPRVQVVERKAQRLDGNGVSLENEMAEVTRSALKFNMFATWVAAEYRNLKFIIDAR